MAAMWQRLLKYLRIAVTTASLCICLLLIVLWMRSYYHHQQLIGRAHSPIMIWATSYDGIADLKIGRNLVLGYHLDANLHDWFLVSKGDATLPFFYSYDEWDCRIAPPELFHVRTPHWFYVTITATIAALPWIKWRFSLKTLLIVMTLLSLFFGAIAWSMRG